MKHSLAIDAATPERWTQGVLARNSEGYDIDPSAPSACRWCAEGAMQSIGATGGKAWRFLVAAIRELDGGWQVYRYNDSHSHAEVLAAYDRAIALAEASQ